MHFFKKLLTLAIICAIGYFILGYHFIVIDKSVKVLKKESGLTLKYTIYSTKGKDPENIMDIPELWDDGIGELLLEEGVISEREYEKFLRKKEAEEAEDYY